MEKPFRTQCGYRKRKHASIELSCLKKSDEKCTKVQKANVEDCSGREIRQQFVQLSSACAFQVGCSIGGELRRQLPQQMSDASSSPQGALPKVNSTTTAVIQAVKNRHQRVQILLFAIMPESKATVRDSSFTFDIFRHLRGIATILILPELQFPE